MGVKDYFDYNATTPMCCEAIGVLTTALQDFGNPSSKYTIANVSKEALSNARIQVARLVGCEAKEIAFTSGGTEANNWAIKGALVARGAIGRNARPAHIIVSQIEHSSVLEITSHLEQVFGIEVTRLKPTAEGLVCTRAVEAALRPTTQLVSLMLVNNEVGTLQPIGQIAEVLRKHGAHFHVDGVQGVGKIHFSAGALGMDTLSFAAHKFYGPKGVGGLYIRDGVRVEPLLHGGGQEGGQRGGTEAVASIAAMGAAAESTYAMLPEMVLRMAAFRLTLSKLLLERVPGVSFHGPRDADLQAPNTLSVCVDGIRAEALAALLDQIHGTQVSLGSACSNNKTVSLSHVLVAMGISESAIKATLRVSIGRYTEEADLVRFVDAMASGVRALQRISKAVSHEQTAAA